MYLFCYRLESTPLTNQTFVIVLLSRKTTLASRISQPAWKTCRQELSAPTGRARIWKCPKACQALTSILSDQMLPGLSAESSLKALCRRTTVTSENTRCSPTLANTLTGFRVSSKPISSIRTLNCSASLQRISSEFLWPVRLETS